MYTRTEDDPSPCSVRILFACKGLGGSTRHSRQHVRASQSPEPNLKPATTTKPRRAGGQEDARGQGPGSPAAHLRLLKGAASPAHLARGKSSKHKQKPPARLVIEPSAPESRLELSSLPRPGSGQGSPSGRVTPPGHAPTSLCDGEEEEEEERGPRHPCPPWRLRGGRGAWPGVGGAAEGCRVGRGSAQAAPRGRGRGRGRAGGAGRRRKLAGRGAHKAATNRAVTERSGAEAPGPPLCSPARPRSPRPSPGAAPGATPGAGASPAAAAAASTWAGRVRGRVRGVAR